MSLTAGARLGPYEILSPLGAGGMGEVYRAKDTRLDRTVAIKILAAHLSSDPHLRQRFEREAKTISSLSHPHICALFDVGREGETEYLVMEYLEGETLSERLARGALPLAQSLRYGIEIAGALDRAHRHGIVHRDLKPGNVMLTKSGVKLLDFGLAKAIEPVSGKATPVTSLPTAEEKLTQEGTLIGTFQYMAPEQLEGKDADARTDIFAFGTLLYEMATGRKAFKGDSQASVISSIMKEEPTPISQIQPLTPRALDRVVATCLAKDPEERWQSAGDVARELKWIAEESQSAAGAPAVARSRRRAGLISWAVAALLLASTLWLANEVRRLRAGSGSQALHAFLIPPEKTRFHLTGDEEAGIALSPDGERAVFGADGKLWVQSLKLGKATPLASTDGARSPFWSPDSRFVAFFSEGKLRTMEASGGPVQTICDAPNPRGGSWGSRGSIVFAPDISTGLVRVPASGGKPEPVTKIDANLHTTHRWPFFLPGGDKVLYIATNHTQPRSDQAGVYAASLDGKENRRVVATYASAQYASGRLLFLRDASLLAQVFDSKTMTLSGEPVRIADDVNFDGGVWRAVFTVSGNGLLAYQQSRTGVGGQLTWVDATGRALSTVGERSEASSPRLSPDGRRVAVIVGDPNNDVWVHEVDRGARTRLTTNARVLPSPVWSSDGSEILFCAQRPGEFILTVTRSDGGGTPRVITVSKERVEPTDWSRDGRHVLVDRGSIGASDIWVYPLAEPEKAFPLVQSPFWETGGQFSPDGRWVVYRSVESGRAEVYVTSFPGGGGRWQISTTGATAPRWGLDGRALYFFSLGPRQGTSLEQEFLAASVEPAGPRFEVGGIQRLFAMNVFVGSRLGIPAYDVAPDGKRFLVNSAGEVGEPRVVLISNWPATLAK